MSAALTRALLYFGIWIVIDQSAKPANLAFGVLAATAATWAILWQSLVAGTDVARRAFSPRLPLQPGFVEYPTDLPRGAARNAFAAISSLLPGSVPTGETETAIEYHALDQSQPVVEQLAAEEQAYGKALIPRLRHG